MLCHEHPGFSFRQRGAEPHKSIAEYRDHLAPGSYLVITHGTLEDNAKGEEEAAEGVYSRASVRCTSGRCRCAALLRQRLTWIAEWRPEPEGTARQHPMRGGVGREP